MKKKTLALTISMLLLSFFQCNAAFAAPDHWQCLSVDSTHKKWLGFALFERTAKEKALDECKKHSIYPRSCRKDKDPCLPPFNYLGHPDGQWICTALDRNGDAWTNIGNPDRYSAALAARAYCANKSTIPKTCYLNTVTCKKRGITN